MVLTRNRRDALRSCVASVLRQQFDDFEIVLLDDASEGVDTAATIALEFSDERIRPYRVESSLGVAGGRNFLMEHSHGEILVVIDDDAVLVDVRSVNQFKDGHIIGARNVPGDQIADGAKALEKFRDQTIITCCDSGATSGAAARRLTELGFSRVVNLRGGLTAWRQDNLPVSKG